MSKELTEKWKDGTLEQKYYYVQFNGNPKPFIEIELKNFLLDLVKVRDRDTIEVLAPVPSYKELQKLKKDLDEYALSYKIGNDVNRLIEEENKKLKEQLEEANKIIYSLKDAKSKAVNDYIEKWLK